MPGNGPRVGGAHVSVNLVFDSSSIKQLAARIEQQLTRIGQRNGRVYRELGASAVTAWRSALGAAMAAGPHIGSAISAIAGAATHMAAALREGVIALGGLLPLVTSLGMAAVTASFGFRNIGAAMFEIDPKKLQQMLDSMTPAAREFALVMRGLTQDLQRDVQPRIFAGLIDEINLLRGTLIPAIHAGFLSMSDSINGLLRDLMRYANSADGLATINTFLQNQASLFGRLSQAVVPFLDGFLRLMNALTPSAERFADRITGIGERFQSWTQGEGFAQRIDERMRTAEHTAGLLWTVISNLSGALSNVFDAVNPSTNSFLEMLVKITEKFEQWSASVSGQNSLAKWGGESNQVMEQFGRTVASVFQVFEQLSQSGAAVSFLKTVQDAFDILGRLPLEQIVGLFVSMADALRPISGPMLAMVIAGASLNVLLGNMMGQTRRGGEPPR
jgi:hypothetical protein